MITEAKQAVAYLERRRGEDARCLVGDRYEPRRDIGEKGRPQLSLSIYGPDQSATEFLSRKKWEEFVRDVNAIMGWT